MDLLTPLMDQLPPEGKVWGGGWDRDGGGLCGAAVRGDVLLGGVPEDKATFEEKEVMRSRLINIFSSM